MIIIKVCKTHSKSHSLFITRGTHAQITVISVFAEAEKYWLLMTNGVKNVNFT